MADLASGQVCFSIRTVVGAGEVAAVQWVRHALRAIDVAGAAVEAGREAAGRRLAALEILTMAGGAGCCAIGRSKTTVIEKWICPTWWMN